MTKEQYVKVTAPLRNNPKRAKLAERLNSMLTGIVFLTYPLYLAFLLTEREPLLARSVIVPLDSFLILTFLRVVINAPRPYEKFGIPPVFSKNTKGKSFPSRHVFSVFVIAETVTVRFPGAGAALLAAGLILALLRVAGGVHEPKDVIAGALAGAAAGLIGFGL